MRKFLYWLVIFSGLSSISFAYGESIEIDRKNFLAAEKAIDRGNNRKLDRLLPRLKGYPLYPYLMYRKLSKTPGAIDPVTSFLDEFADTRYPTLLRWKLLQYLASKEKWSEYISHYKKTVSPKLQCNYYWALYKTGRKSEALSGARKLWLAGRSRPKACDKLFVKLQASQIFSPELAWQRFELSMQKGNSRLARYLKQFIPQDQQQVAEFWLKVHQTPRKILKCFGDNITNPHMGRIFVHGIDRLIRSDLAIAHAAWTSRKDSFDIDDKDRGYIENRLGIALATRRDPAAAKFLGKIDLKLAGSSLREWRVRNALMRQNWQSVLLYLDQLEEVDRSSIPWMYWRARSLAALGKSAEAEKIYTDIAKDRSYYGFKTSDLLEIGYTWSDRPADVSDDEIRQLADRRTFKAVFEFRHLRRESLARREWWHGVRKLNQRKVLVAAKLAQQWGWDEVAIFTIAKVKYWDDLGLRFPLLFQEVVVNNATRQQLRPAFVYGVIRQESVFNQYANSSAGARGLMQIMPATGRRIARNLKEKWISNRALYETDINVRYGTTYLKGLLSQFDQNFALAVAAYNAGEHRVERWLPVDKSIPADIWIENIPFKETRNYVKVVLAYAVIYQQRLNEELLRVSSLVDTVGATNKFRAKNTKLTVLAACKK